MHLPPDECLGLSIRCATAGLTRAQALDRPLPLRRLDAIVHVGDRDHVLLAWAQYRFNALADYDGALEDCFGKQAVELRPENAEYHSACGDREQAIAAMTDSIHRSQ